MMMREVELKMAYLISRVDHWVKGELQGVYGLQSESQSENQFSIDKNTLLIKCFIRERIKT